MILSMTLAAPGQLEPRLGLDGVQNFERVTGIKKTRRFDKDRGYAGPSTALAVAAVERHKAAFPEHFEDLDAIVVVTQSPDRNSPAMAVELQRAFAIRQNVMAFDVNQSCDGFVYGLSIAASIGRVLLVCVDRLRAKPGTTEALLFSDGAVAAIVEPGGFTAEAFLTDGTGAQRLHGDEKGRLVMDGGKVFDFVTKEMPPFIGSYDGRYGKFDLLAQHQPNLSMMKLVESRSGFSGRSLHSIAEYGNMSMVSVAAAIAANEERALGKSLLLCGYGAGWSAAAMGIKRWPSEPICRIAEV